MAHTIKPPTGLPQPGARPEIRKTRIAPHDRAGNSESKQKVEAKRKSKKRSGLIAGIVGGTALFAGVVGVGGKLITGAADDSDGGRAIPPVEGQPFNEAIEPTSEGVALFLDSPEAAESLEIAYETPTGLFETVGDINELILGTGFKTEDMSVIGDQRIWVDEGARPAINQLVSTTQAEGSDLFEPTFVLRSGDIYFTAIDNTQDQLPEYILVGKYQDNPSQGVLSSRSILDVLEVTSDTPKGHKVTMMSDGSQHELLVDPDINQPLDLSRMLSTDFPTEIPSSNDPAELANQLANLNTYIRQNGDRRLAGHFLAPTQQTAIEQIYNDMSTWNSVTHGEWLYDTVTYTLDSSRGLSAINTDGNGSIFVNSVVTREDGQVISKQDLLLVTTAMTINFLDGPREVTVITQSTQLS